MIKRFTITALAAAVALGTAFSAPARAMDTGEFGRLMLGIGALAVIGSQIQSQNRKTTYTSRGYNDDYDRDYYRPRTSYKAARQACRRSDGYGNFYISARCMADFGY